MAKGRWEYPDKSSTVQPPSEPRDDDARDRAVAAIRKAHRLCQGVAASSADMRVADAYEAATATLADVAGDLSADDADEILEDDD